MVDIVASDVTVTVEKRLILDEIKRNRVKIVFGNGVLTYPSGGVPMPAKGVFGMVQRLDYLDLFDSNDASGIMWKYDKDNNKIRGYEFDYPNVAEGAAIELDAGTDAPAAQTFYADAVGY